MDLDELREKIDGIDEEIVRLINRRAEIAHEIGKLKADEGDSVYKPHRERAVLEHAEEASTGPMAEESIRAVFREIMSGCIALEKPVKVAYLGPEGTFTHWAARSKFGDSIIYEPVPSLEEVFEEVERGRVDYGVVPVENSTEGGIRETLARMVESPLKVCAEIVYAIEHALMARCPLEDIERIYSKGTVFGQTRRWLREHLPGIDRIEVASTAQAAEKAEQEQGAAAIGHAGMATLHELDVLFDGIQDRADNETRFFVLGEHASAPTGDDKTALLCAVKDRAGALRDLLDPFKHYGINMTKIESFPAPGAGWEYYFFIDFVGHPEQERTVEALDEMEKQCNMLKVLGAFPRKAG
ncbi:MAG: prephenate dehydratase [Planctomycetota bacterium]